MHFIKKNASFLFLVVLFRKKNYKKPLIVLFRKKNYKKPLIVLFRKKNYKNPIGWGGRGNLGFPTRMGW